MDLIIHISGMKSRSTITYEDEISYNINNLCTGDYTIVATDANGCTGDS